FDALACAARLEAVRVLHDAGLDQLLVELAHLGEQLFGFGREDALFAVGGGLDEDEEFHGSSGGLMCLESSRTGQWIFDLPSAPAMRPVFKIANCDLKDACS